MEKHKKWTDIVLFGGIFLMILGAVDPLEGSVLIVIGSFLTAFGAHRKLAPNRMFLWTAFALVSIGVAAMFGLSFVGGIGGDAEYSMWWGLTIVPYPVGWAMMLAGTIGKTAFRWLVYIAFILMGTGITSLMVFTSENPRNMEDPMFWILMLLPYLVGVLLCLIASILAAVRQHTEQRRISKGSEV